MRSLGNLIDADLINSSWHTGHSCQNQLQSGAAGPTLWSVINATLVDELYEVDHLKTPTWPSNGGRTADKVTTWPEFGSEALAFMGAHEELLRDTRVPQTLPLATKVFDDAEPVTREWQIYEALHLGIYSPVNFAAQTVGLGVFWTCSAGEGMLSSADHDFQSVCLWSSAVTAP